MIWIYTSNDLVRKAHVQNKCARAHYTESKYVLEHEAFSPVQQALFVIHAAYRSSSLSAQEGALRAFL